MRVIRVTDIKNSHRARRGIDRDRARGRRNIQGGKIRRVTDTIGNNISRPVLGSTPCATGIGNPSSAGCLRESGQSKKRNGESRNQPASQQVVKLERAFGEIRIFAHKIRIGGLDAGGTSEGICGKFSATHICVNALSLLFFGRLRGQIPTRRRGKWRIISCRPRTVPGLVLIGFCQPCIRLPLRCHRDFERKNYRGS